MTEKELHNKRNNKKNRRKARHKRWFEKHGPHHPSVRRSKHGLTKRVSPRSSHVHMARERGMRKEQRVVTRRVSLTPELRAEMERLRQMGKVGVSDLISLLQKATKKVLKHGI